MIQLATAERHEGRTAADLGSVDGCRLAPDLLAEIASGLAISESPWQPDGTADYTRRYRQLLSTDQYDAWLIWWPPGTGLDLHDHGGSAGAFAVVAGTLHETVAAGAALSTHRLRAGETSRFGIDHVHAVRNDGDGPATSVHVYSPPLQSMDFYEHGAAGVMSTRHDPGDWAAVA